MSRKELLDKLIEKARNLPPLTQEEREEQSVCFAYGNLACTTNHRPKRRVFESMLRRLGWTEERIQKWCDAREWWE